jgi:hypothetical protein
MHGFIERIEELGLELQSSRAASPRERARTCEVLLHEATRIIVLEFPQQS